MVDKQKSSKVTPDLIRRMARLLTGHEGSESLNRFARQLVIGAARLKGFEDAQNRDLRAVYDRPHVLLGHFAVLTRFSFVSEAGKYIWDFASGVSEGQKLDGVASSRGRISKWVGDGAKKNWEEHNITGVVLVGMGADVQFFYMTKEEFLLRGEDRIVAKWEHGNEPHDFDLQRWSKAWDGLVFQQSFGSLMGGE